MVEGSLVVFVMVLDGMSQISLIPSVPEHWRDFAIAVTPFVHDKTAVETVPQIN